MNIRESLNKLDHKAFDNETKFYDLVTLYESVSLNENEKKELCELCEKEDSEVIYDYLYKKLNGEDDDELQFVDTRKNSIVRGDDDYGFDEYDLKEARSYGGAFDIADDQLFTREDLNAFGYDVADALSAESYSKIEYNGCWVDGNKLTVSVSWNDCEVETEVTIDYRKLNKVNLDPWRALWDSYAKEICEKLKKELIDCGADFGPHLNSQDYPNESLTEGSSNTRDYRFKVSCNNEPEEIVNLIWYKNDLEGAKEEAKWYYKNKHNVYSRDTDNDWNIEEVKLDKYFSHPEYINEDLSTKVSVEQLVKMCDNEEGKRKLQKIVDTNNTQAFEELIEDMYPNGITLNSLFDLIQNDWDLVADELDLNESVNEATEDFGAGRKYNQLLNEINRDAKRVINRTDNESPASVLKDLGYEYDEDLDDDYPYHIFWKEIQEKEADGHTNIYDLVFDFTKYDETWGEEPVKYYVLMNDEIPKGYTVTKTRIDEGILQKVVSGAKKLGNAVKNSAAASFVKGAYDNSVAKKVVDTAKKVGSGVKNYVKNDMPVKEEKYKIYYYNQEKEPEKVVSQDVIDTTGQTITRAQLVAAANKKVSEDQPQFRILDANNRIIADTTSEKGAQEAEKNVEFQKKEADKETVNNIKKMKDSGLTADEIKDVLTKRGMDPKRIEQFVK